VFCRTLTSFRAWLGTRIPEVPDAAAVALAIVQAGAAGVSAEELRRVAGCSRETLRELLAGLVASGQVEMVSAGGRIVYRAAR
jgi:DNA-binding IclR family transcriptional regulator